MTDDRLTAAREYIKRGWIVHPLSSPKVKDHGPGKKPLFKKWPQLEKVTENDICRCFPGRQKRGVWRDKLI